MCEPQQRVVSWMIRLLDGRTHTCDRIQYTQIGLEHDCRGIFAESSDVQRVVLQDHVEVT